MSASNPMHRSINAGNTKRNERKLERSWEELQSEKLGYIKRLREEQEAKERAKMWEPEEDIYDDPTF